MIATRSDVDQLVVALRAATAAMGLFFIAGQALAQTSPEAAQTASTAPMGQRPLPPNTRQRVRLGPLVSSGFPSVLGVGFAVAAPRLWSAGLSLGMVPTLRFKLLGRTTVSYQQYDAWGRFHPFANGFFLGAGLGFRVLRATVANNVDTSSMAGTYGNLSIPPSIDYQSSGRLRSWIMTPQLGYFHTSSTGFGIGFFAGAQIPVSSGQISYQRSLSSLPQKVVDTYLAPVDANVQSSLRSASRYVLPTLGLQLGWLF